MYYVDLNAFWYNAIVHFGYFGAKFPVGCFALKAFQSMSEKKGCAIISSPPSWSPWAWPSLLFGFLFSKQIMRSLTALEKLLRGSFSLPLIILLKSSSLFLEKYGVTPTSTSYKSTPRRYQSNAFPWPIFLSISGAKYLTDPQNVLAPLAVSIIFVFAIPKSINLTWPSLSITTLSGFKSLYIILCLCSSLIARTISAI